MWCSIRVSVLLLVGLAPLAPAWGQEQHPAADVVALSEVPRQHDSLLRLPARLTVGQVPLAAALKALHYASGVDLVFSPSLLPPAHTVTCRCQEATVAEALEVLLSGTGLAYGEVDGHVVIASRPAASRGPERNGMTVKRELAGAGSGGSRTELREVAATPVQEPFVAGIVVDARTLEPLAGAQIVVEGTDQGTISDARGRFRIQNVRGTDVTLQVVLLGYRTLTQTVRVGDAALRLALEQTAIELDQIVVTGTPGEARRRTLGNAVGLLDVARLVEIAPTPNLQGLLSANVAGLRTQPSSGQVGSGGRTRIRGAGTISLSEEPLVYVDGVRVDNTASVPSVAFRRADPPSAINYLNPEEIERIEVIKGPAAATIYGTEASNGVIQIITKKGRPGRAAVELSLTQGVNWLPSPEKVFPANYWVNPETSQVERFHVLEADKARGFASPFQTGRGQGYAASVRGGSEDVQYFGSLGFERDEGIVSYNWQNRRHGRLNLSYTPSGKLQAGLNLALARIRARSASVEQPVTTRIIWSEPFNKDGPGRGYMRDMVPEAFDRIEGFEEIDRATLGINLAHTPARWFTQRVAVGGDYRNERSSHLYPLDPTLPFPTNQFGQKQVLELRAAFETVDYSATASLGVTPALTLATSGGVQYYRKQFQTLLGTGQNFPVPQVETVSGAASVAAGESFLENRTFGAYVQEQLAWKNRLFVTGALRGDDNSAFGKNFDFVLYPKLSTSWILSEEPFFRDVPLVNTLKLRAAWGRAGQQPDVFAAIRLYEPSVGPGSVSTLTPSNLGNPDLEPEKGEELELGLDASLWDERIALEFTYYDQKTKDAIVARSPAPSSGFPGVEFLNIGEVSNRGIELAFNVRIVDNPDLGWEVGGKYSHNTNEVVSLGGLPPITIYTVANQRNLEGFPLGSFFLKRVVSAELDATGHIASNVLCDGGDPKGKKDENGRPLEFGGPPVPCAEAPELYWGQPNPVWEGSLTTTVTLFRNLRLSGQVDFLGGHMLQDNDVSAAHVFFRRTKAIVEGGDPILEGYDALAGEGRWQPGMVKAGFARLRNVSAAYTLPEPWTRQIGAARASVILSAHNVAVLWWAQREVFGRTRTDPELRWSQFEGAFANRGINQEQWPHFTRLVTTLRVTF